MPYIVKVAWVICFKEILIVVVKYKRHYNKKIF